MELGVVLDRVLAAKQKRCERRAKLHRKRQKLSSDRPISRRGCECLSFNWLVCEFTHFSLNFMLICCLTSSFDLCSVYVQGFCP